MTTKTSGGRITGLIALSMEATVALNVGDPVMGSGDYECILNDGSKPCIGHVSVANKAPTRGTATRAAQVPGPVTVEARGFYVRKCLASAAIAAGAGVVYGAAGALAAAAGYANAQGANVVGIALTASTGAGQYIDVLFN